MAELDEILSTKTRTEDAKPAEEGARLPAPGDPYKAFIAERVSGRTALTLHLIKPSGEIRSKPYMHLDDAGFAEDGTSFWLLFGGLEPQKITVHGRNLLRFYDMIGAHRIHSIVQGTGDGGQEKATYVSKIAIEDFKPED